MLFSVAAAVGAAPAQRFAAIEGIVEDSMASNGVPGVSVAIIDDYDVVYARGYWVRGTGSPGDHRSPISGRVAHQAKYFGPTSD